MAAITIPEKLKSRKLWLALLASVIAFGNAMWDWGLKPEQVWPIIVPLLAYIGVEGTADVFRARNGVKP